MKNWSIPRSPRIDVDGGIGYRLFGRRVALGEDVELDGKNGEDGVEEGRVQLLF